MKKNEFEALLKIQDRYLLMCTVNRATHNVEEQLYAADVVDRKHEVVLGGTPAKTPAAAVQRTIAGYFKQNANN